MSRLLRVRTARQRRLLPKQIAVVLCSALLACAQLAASTPSSSPQAEHPPYGIIVMAHGGNDEWNERIRHSLRDTPAEVPVRIAFGMADRAALEAALRELEESGLRRILVVRLFVSGESFLQQTAYLFGLDRSVPDFLFDSAQGGPMRPVADPASVPPIQHTSEISIVAAGLVDAEFTGRILAQRVLQLSTDPARETVVVIAHGQGNEAENTRLLATLRERARSIEGAAAFREVTVVTLREDWPEERALSERRIRDSVRRGSELGNAIVVPFRVAGFGPYADVLEGLEYKADGLGLLPHDDVATWVMDSARRLACANDWIRDCDRTAVETHGLRQATAGGR